MLTLPLAALALTAAGADLEALVRTPPPVNYAPGAEYRPEARKYQGIASLERAPGGRLWAVWYAGPVHEDKDNYVVGVTSGDGGATWSDLQFVIDPDGAGPVRASDPCPWLDPQGRLWLFFFQNAAGSLPALFAMTCDDPDSAQPHWSAPRYLHDGILMCKPIVDRHSDWLLPTAIWHRAGSCRLVASSDQGQTWQLRGTATVPRPADRDCDEPMLVERRDGSLWMLVRTKYGLGETISTDRGQTWTEVTPTALAHATSRFFLRRLRSGNLLLVKHGPLTVRTGRTHLTAYLSRDDGATWEGGLLLDERATVSYPDGCEAPDGTVRIIYDWNRADEKQILLATCTEADVLAGRDVSGRVRLRGLINQATGVNPKPWLRDGRFLGLRPNSAGQPLATGPAAGLVDETRPVVAGERVFTDRDYRFEALPPALGTRRFVCGSIAGSQVVCQTAGLALLLTPQADRNADSLAGELLAQGWQLVALPEFVLFRGADGGLHGGNVVSVYQRELRAGETVTLGKWGVLVY
ncbi:MAG: exo-alpha-sialidase [Fimbriimonadaceae bacterium]|nr:exo-alpha-sialidase [Fimbriimonadaceae bacterium]